MKRLINSLHIVEWFWIAVVVWAATTAYGAIVAASQVASMVRT